MLLLPHFAQRLALPLAPTSPRDLYHTSPRLVEQAARLQSHQHHTRRGRALLGPLCSLGGRGRPPAEVLCPKGRQHPPLPGSCGPSKVLCTRGRISRTDLWHGLLSSQSPRSDIPLISYINLAPVPDTPPHPSHRLILVPPLTRIYSNPIPRVSLRGISPSS